MFGTEKFNILLNTFHYYILAEKFNSVLKNILAWTTCGEVPPEKLSFK